MAKMHPHAKVGFDNSPHLTVYYWAEVGADGTVRIQSRVKLKDGVHVVALDADTQEVYVNRAAAQALLYGLDIPEKPDLRQETYQPIEYRENVILLGGPNSTAMTRPASMVPESFVQSLLKAGLDKVNVGELAGEYLMVSRLPNFLSDIFDRQVRSDPAEWPYLAVMDGMHGTGTRGVELLFRAENRQFLEEVRRRRGGACFFQAVFEFGDVSVDAAAGNIDIAHSIRRVVAVKGLQADRDAYLHVWSNFQRNLEKNLDSTRVSPVVGGTEGAGQSGTPITETGDKGTTMPQNEEAFRRSLQQLKANDARAVTQFIRWADPDRKELPKGRSAAGPAAAMLKSEAESFRAKIAQVKAELEKEFTARLNQMEAEFAAKSTGATNGVRDPINEGTIPEPGSGVTWGALLLVCCGLGLCHGWRVRRSGGDSLEALRE